MSRRRRDRSADKAEALVKLAFVLLMLVALGVGGLSGFSQVLAGLLKFIVIIVVGAAVLGLVGLLLVRIYRSNRTTDFIPHSNGAAASHSFDTRPIKNVTPVEPPKWTALSIRQALDEIDWYQFEKFCAALLRADGFSVERKGGAQPDGGVDLLVEKGGARALIQCKHWRTWVVQEKIVREMLGSMTHLNVRQGAIYTLKGWTQPAEKLANEHAITLVNGDELARSAVTQLTAEKLEAVLRPREHHCPKCESVMHWKTGDFKPFWGCSRFPRCRGKINHSGAT